MTHYISYLNLEVEVSSYKMHRFIHNLSSNWQWAWQAQFLSYWPITLENWISFRDVQMILVSFFEIPYVDRLTKNVQKLHVQVIPKSTYRCSLNFLLISSLPGNKYISPPRTRIPSWSGISCPQFCILERQIPLVISTCHTFFDVLCAK